MVYIASAVGGAAAYRRTQNNASMRRRAAEDLQRQRREFAAQQAAHAARARQLHRTDGGKWIGKEVSGYGARTGQYATKNPTIKSVDTFAGQPVWKKPMYQRRLSVGLYG